MDMITPVIPFRTKNTQYLYDDASGIIHLWSDLMGRVLELYLHHDRAQIIEMLGDEHPVQELEAAYDYIALYSQNYNSFFRKKGIKNELLDVLDGASAETIAKNVNSGLLVSLTDSCDFRCKYCVYSDAYPLTKNKAPKFLSFENARKGLELYFEFIDEVIQINPRKTFTVAFYGGEPLLNAKVMFQIIDAVNDRYQGRFAYNVTTNGMNLTPSICEKLAERRVNVYVSLDGPEKEHDRLRVDCEGQGTYQKIIEKLQYLKMTFPEYYNNQVSLVSVYDLKTDLLEVDHFFERQAAFKTLPPNKIVNRVIDAETTYYQQFTDQDYSKCSDQYGQIKAAYLDKTIKGEPVTPYSKSMVGMNYLSIALRKRYLDTSPQEGLTGTSCYPGSKIFLDTQGSFGLCERVNGSHPIGDLSLGIDKSKLLDILRSYYAEVVTHCNNCSISRLCGSCFRSFEKEGEFIYDPQICKNSKEFVMNSLMEFAKLGELNPNFSVMAYSKEESYFIDEFSNL